MRAKELYEDDFVAWTEGQARHLRALHTSRWNGPLDLEHLAKEIEDLGRSQRHACETLPEQIIIQLLKLRCAKTEAPRAHWANEIDLFRNELQRRLTPTNRQHLATTSTPTTKPPPASPPEPSPARNPARSPSSRGHVLGRSTTSSRATRCSRRKGC